ncbi:hypothetical protein AUP68_10393 [Ilyonectria robusta]
MTANVSSNCNLSEASLMGAGYALPFREIYGRGGICAHARHTLSKWSQKPWYYPGEVFHNDPSVQVPPTGDHTGLLKDYEFADGWVLPDCLNAVYEYSLGLNLLHRRGQERFDEVEAEAGRGDRRNQSEEIASECTAPCLRS